MATTPKRRPKAALMETTAPPVTLADSDEGGTRAPILAVNINRACDVLGISRSSVYELISSGDLTLARVAGRSVVTMDSIRAVLERGVKQREAEVQADVARYKAVAAAAKKTKAARS